MRSLEERLHLLGACSSALWPCRDCGDFESSGFRGREGNVRRSDTVSGERTRVVKETSMKKSNFALRLQPSLMEEAPKVAKAEGVAMNQLINVAVAEKVSALRTEEYFAE